MTTAIAFTVPGKPQGKARPRMTRTGHTYTPKQTVCYENRVRLMAAEAMQGGAAWEGPVELSMVVVMERPQSHYGTGKNAGKVKTTAPAVCCRLPDLDNVIKAISDACSNGIVYRDDRQIVSLHCERQWAGEYTKPGVYVKMREQEIES